MGIFQVRNRLTIYVIIDCAVTHCISKWSVTSLINEEGLREPRRINVTMARKLSPPFRPGEVVVLKTGTAPQVVTDVNYSNGVWHLRCRYTRYFPNIEEAARNWRRADDYLHYVGDPEDHDYNQKVNTVANAPKLYQTLEETPRFGTYLATNSLGQIVLEMKGAQANVIVEAFDKDKVEEVKPYTILVRFRDGTERNYTTTKDKVKEGEAIIFENLDFGVIVKINTGFSGNCSELKGRRVLTEEL